MTKMVGIGLQHRQPLVQPPHITLDAGVDHVGMQGLDEQDDAGQQQQHGWWIADAQACGQAVDHPGPDAEHDGSHGNDDPEQPVHEVEVIAPDQVQNQRGQPYTHESRCYLKGCHIDNQKLPNESIRLMQGTPEISAMAV